jgi:lysozyme
MRTPLVIDLYHGNAEPDWPALKASGIVGVIHKATESTDFHDPEYPGRRQRATQAGLLWGAYHFLRPGSMNEQVDYFLAYARPDPQTLIAADHEDSGVSLDELKSFLFHVATTAGLEPVLYSGSVIKEQLGNKIDLQLGSYRLWLAEYCSPPPKWPTATWQHWWLWQYTDTGHLKACPDACDLSNYAGSPTALIADWSGGSPPAKEAA